MRLNEDGRGLFGEHGVVKLGLIRVGVADRVTVQVRVTVTVKVRIAVTITVRVTVSRRPMFSVSAKS